MAHDFEEMGFDDPVATAVADVDTAASDVPNNENPGPTEVVQASAIHLSLPEVIVGMVAMLVWFILFSGGIIIGTEQYRNNLNASIGTSAWFGSWFVVCAFWTITNVGLLACVSAYVGALGRRTRFTSHTDPMQATFGVTGTNKKGVSTYYLSAIMRGFGIYTLVLAGLLVFATESLANPPQSMYMRLAPTVSIIGLYVGYDPGMFAELLDRVKRFLQTGSGAGGGQAS